MNKEEAKKRIEELQDQIRDLEKIARPFTIENGCDSIEILSNGIMPVIRINNMLSIADITIGNKNDLIDLISELKKYL